MSCCPYNNQIDKDTIKLHVARYIPELHKLTDKWLSLNWPVFHEGNILAFHAPVGNGGFFTKDRLPKVIISGFCVARKAGVSFIKSSLDSGKLNDAAIAARHSFDTPTMQRGLIKLLNNNKVPQMLNMSSAEEAIEQAKNGEAPLFLTQALCPIIDAGSSSAPKVWRALKKSNKLRKFISHSLTKWWVDINKVSVKETVKGNPELKKLLAFSKLHTDGQIEITASNQGDESVLKKVESLFPNIIWDYHAAYYGRF